ncbi:uncharacterized protein BYT42DRAFT_386545 [Radiomyces spectabilis]|uniref:uncharacterized protein n=1 Tax=Radiomyces spectabilis TaxID=64574 RepID=UPI00221F16B3|nr:uncharacterized protein BYT42DRAFT_386545 [Radiomyces spectabilis]KAI8376438.1 hypothetical protein BYT42DRAFT_386545 [Radiomyces spectabilis]
MNSPSTRHHLPRVFFFSFLLYLLRLRKLLSFIQYEEGSKRTCPCPSSKQEEGTPLNHMAGVIASRRRQFFRLFWECFRTLMKGSISKKFTVQPHEDPSNNPVTVAHKKQCFNMSANTSSFIHRNNLLPMVSVIWSR